MRASSKNDRQSGALSPRDRFAAAGGVIILAGMLASCGSAGSFGLTSDDNNPQQLAAALQTVQTPEASAPINSTGKPLVFMVVSPSKKEHRSKQLVAFDLAGKSELWRVDAQVGSKVAVGANFVAFREGDRDLVAVDVATGKRLWKKNIGPNFLGLAADRSRAFYVTRDKSGSKPVWWLVAVDGKTGEELWRADAPGQLGAPAARGGLVFSPFLKQWLAVLDANTGKQLTRIRGIDEEISFVRTTNDHVYFGSNFGVFLLDDRAASGKRAESTYGSAELPEGFVRTHYYWDAFDPVQAGYSAYDRNRILWRGDAEGDKLGFADGQVVVHTYRFFFAFNAADGSLRWAYNHPRVDVIGSEYLSSVIAFVSALGDIGALDPETGRRVYKAKLGGTQRLLGATFDAGGWSPSEAGGSEAQSTVAALASIARDRDARFNAVKKFAIAALAKLPGGEVTRDLLALIRDERTPPALYKHAAEALVERKDPAGVPYLLEALATQYDYIAGTKPRAVNVVAQAIGAMGDVAFDGATRGKLVDALLAHLNAPETPIAELSDIVRALGAVGAGAESVPLRAFLLAYRADPAFSAKIGALGVAVDVLLRTGDAADREVVAFVASEPRTQKGLLEYAARALTQSARAKPTEGAAQ